MERIQIKNACHYFMACRPDRPKSSYQVDFSSLESLKYVPMFRLRCGLDGKRLYRPDWRMNLDQTQLSFVRHVDGVRNIREIAAQVAQDGVLNSPTAREKYARNLFQELWRLDFFTMAR
jgi:hypothetical protein